MNNMNRSPRFFGFEILHALLAEWPIKGVFVRRQSLGGQVHQPGEFAARVFVANLI